MPTPPAPDALPASLPQPLQHWVQSHRRWLVITGAGCSTEVGIPDYRDRDGQWKRPQPVTYQAFMGDVRVRQRYWARSLLGWPVMGLAPPGRAHHALAALERAGRVELLLTQNVDGLHSKAGSQRTLDLHGRIDTVRCMDCDHRFARADWQNALVQHNPAWAALQAAAAPDGDADLEGQAFAQFHIPPCPQCGAGLLKPDVVFFGESVPRARVDAAMAALGRVDGVLIAGSSLMVYSGFRFVQAAAQAGVPIVAINQGLTRADALLDVKVQADVGATLQALAAVPF